MVRLLAPVVVLLAAIAATVATDRAQRPADFTLINRGDVTTLDLQKMSWIQDLRIGRALFEGLVKSDVFSWDFRIKPGVAERWEVSADGLRYTFHLRADARWSNGEPVTAEQFVYSWRRGLLPDTGCDYAQMFQKIKGAKAFYEWRQGELAGFRAEPGDGSRPLAETGAARLWARTVEKFAEMVALRAPDARTLEFELINPTPYFLELCGLPVFYPVYPPLVSQYERPDRATGRLDIQFGWTKPPLLVSNGPFVLTAWRYRRDMRMEKNRFFWDGARIALDSMAIPSVEDPNAAVLACRSGGIDWLSDVTPTYRADMLADKRAFYAEHRAEYEEMVNTGVDPVEIDRRLPPDPRNRVHAFPAFGTYFYNFNCGPKLQDGRANPFADPRVRKAFAVSIDKERIVGQIRRVGEKPALTLIPPGSITGYTSPAGVPYNPALARELLAAAGFPGGKGLLTVELLFNTDGGHDLVAQAVAKDWEENLGVRVVLARRETAVFKDDLKKQNYMVARAGWFGDYGDPTTFLDLDRRDDGNNDRKYDSPAYESLMDASDAEADPAKRMKLLEEAERMTVEDEFPLIPLYQYMQIYYFDPHRVTGISSHPRQEQDVYEFDVIGDGKGTDAPRALPERVR